MNLLNFELYKKLCAYSPTKQDEDEWERQYNCWVETFNQFKDELPDEFVSEFEKKHFHDYQIRSLLLLSSELPCSICINLNHSDNDHLLTFVNVMDLNVNLKNISSGFVEWLVCEIGKINEATKYISILCSHGDISFRFETLNYSKTLN